MLYSLVKSLVLPPTGLFLLILIGVWRWRRPLTGRGLVLLSTLLLLVLSLPIVSHRLMQPLEPYPALAEADLQRPAAQAIVLLGAGRNSDALEYDGDTVGPLTLQRMRYAAWLQQRTGLPLFVSAGSPPHEDPPLGRIMARVLRDEFQVPVTAVEDQSRTTWENAAFTAPLLRQRGIERVYVVSHAWHLPRAMRAFERQGLQPIPAPTGFETRYGDDGLLPGDFYPEPTALLRSYYAIHEYLGRAWYALRERLD